MLGENPELLVFTIGKVAIAANNFTFDNKLGEGFEVVDCKGIRDQADDFRISGFDLRYVLVGQTVAYDLQKFNRDMEFDKIYPDGQLLNDFIAVFAKGYVNTGSLRDAKSIVTDLEKSEPDNVSWNMLIDCHYKYGQHDKADELLQEMNDSRCSLCCTTYNIMINSLGQQEKWDELMGLIEKMWSQRVKPNVIMYIILIYVYGQSGRFKDAIEYLEVMKSTGFKAISYNVSRLGQCIYTKTEGNVSYLNVLIEVMKKVKLFNGDWKLGKASPGCGLPFCDYRCSSKEYFFLEFQTSQLWDNGGSASGTPRGKGLFHSFVVRNKGDEDEIARRKSEEIHP
ncbi:hypothetical protein GIB67_019145 [Kingdonia uniflora]|uniref:Pentatricopeptide repeat-containing protein n=1 Tax=Kingdonia uniflora TaxID=39325 RepID=A0A7J7MZS1_9MAGN|nr:hypothetical protein GIB67_019145 [Kingdonia uniflora]